VGIFGEIFFLLIGVAAFIDLLILLLAVGTWIEKYIP